MATPTLFFSSVVSFRLLPRRLNPNSLLLHLIVPRRRTSPFASPAMSFAPRFFILDDADDPLDFGAVTGAQFHPLRRCAGIKRAAASEAAEVRAVPPEVVEGRPDGGVRSEEEVKARSAEKGNSNSDVGDKTVKIIGNSDTHLDKKAVKIIGNSNTHLDKKNSNTHLDKKNSNTHLDKKNSNTHVDKKNSNTHLDKKSIKIMTYNVWFREDLELKRRMNALGNLIRHHSPDLICFQEVTPNIYLLFEKSDWWEGYKCSLSHEKAMVGTYYCMQMSKLPVQSYDCIPFSNSHMGRKLCIADVNIGDVIKLVLATSHLESPCPGPPTWDQMFSKERVAQANKSLSFLGAFSNVIFCGDMNWDDKGDGPFPLPDGWIDAWAELKPGENGWTYDTKANVMLTGNRKLQKRLDRFVCKLSDFKVDSIDMIGTEPIPDVTYIKEKKVQNEIRQLQLAVFPSDHFGLLLTITY